MLESVERTIIHIYSYHFQCRGKSITNDYCARHTLANRSFSIWDLEAVVQELSVCGKGLPDVSISKESREIYAFLITREITYAYPYARMLQTKTCRAQSMAKGILYTGECAVDRAWTYVGICTESTRLHQLLRQQLSVALRLDSRLKVGVDPPSGIVAPFLALWGPSARLLRNGRRA